jgi:hypothetical protein
LVSILATAFAHHGYDAFHLDRRVTIEGVLEEITYANPHVSLKIRTDDAQLYTARWLGIAGLERRGITRTTLSVGDRVLVVGSPPRDPASREIAVLRHVKRMNDGWAWGPEQHLDREH